jgi:FAD/FMN-containing dehydrogenase/Fe-S oxidoreductase
MSAQTRIREIPYNYTSFSDREIVMRLLGAEQWEVLNQLRGQRRTGRSARMLFEVLGDMWVIQRNPFIQDDLLDNPKRRDLLIGALQHRLSQIENRADGNQLALQLLNSAKKAVNEFEQQLIASKQLRQKIFNQLKKVTRKDNIRFDGMARVSHVTDATDWRVAYPVVVLYPDTEQEILDLIATCIELELTIIPRGGGTGYTGGAVPLHELSAVINTEKLEKIAEPEKISQNNQQFHIIHVEAGAITADVARKAAEHKLIFAVDPTSQEASTIGGNIAMNAGGKKAVLWGTTIDNLLSWKMVTPDAKWLEVERLHHNLGKIHDEAFAEFRLTYYEKDGITPIGEPETLKIAATEFRKSGLGKDVTNKYLGGLPGAQKEGCDGFITSAKFVLYPEPTHIRTICLEFFGSDLSRAVPAIVETKDYLDSLDNVLLSGMEHLDERYIRAVKYSTKAPRHELPKMLLLIDIASEDEQAVGAAASHIVKLANARDAEGFIAVTPEARNLFWQDRKRTAAIAAHTNAFKVNEDVVIPLENLGQYNDEIERINIEHSTTNKIKIIDEILQYLASDMPELRKTDGEEMADSAENDAIIERKKQAARDHLQAARQRWVELMDNLDNPPASVKYSLLDSTQQAIQPNDTIFRMLQRRDLRISYRESVAKILDEIFIGHSFTHVREKLLDIHKKIRNSRVFVALHMHAGDGNVHTNIPVHSNDYEMLHEAEHVVEKVMQIAEKLGGVISGEHGIGITKLQFLKPELLEKFNEYKSKVDPNGIFNRSKLTAQGGLQNAYTPSLRLLEQEALILEASALGDLNYAIKDCLRCGKCKPVCNTHVPRANLLYSPRNKILATGLIIEAFLYEEQTRRGISLRHFDEMNDVADHCTVCHKCFTPCPVNIDFGDVTVKMREILKSYGKRRVNITAKAAMGFLNITDPTKIKLMRKAMIEWAFMGQRAAHTIFKKAGLLPNQQPAATTGKMAIPAQVINFVKRPMPAQVPARTMRSLLNVEDNSIVPILRNPNKITDDSDAVFYFPGCGSERLFSQVGLATLAALYELGTETVLPPGYLCCGYPQASVGDVAKGSQITMQNRILFHRIANTLNYMDIKTVIVSCGTCMDQLLKYEFSQIFPDCRLLDIHEYMLEKGMSLDGMQGEKYMYHDPCHTPMKQYQPLKVATELLGKQVVLSERCCGEAGTFATSRPDIATQVRFRKQEELNKGMQKLGVTENETTKLLTACPACTQGLSRYRDESNIDVDYIVVEVMKQKFGEEWQQNFLDSVGNGGIERVLL